MSLSDRSLGWLRSLDRKAATADNWDRDGRPHPHWDDRTGAPVPANLRGDLVESALGLGLMALRTPAWTDRYSSIADHLIERHLRWWGAADWLTQLGHDPDRGHYPDVLQGLVPAERWGGYDAPGWAANGTEPWGLQLDPVLADGNLSYKASLLLLLGIRATINPDGRWNRAFRVFGDSGEDRTWTHAELAAHVAEQWAAHPDGPHSENTKVWPEHLAMAGLGLLLADRHHGTDHHGRVAQPWWERARSDDFGLDQAEVPGTVTRYRDPQLGLVVHGPVSDALATACWLAPVAAEDARRIFDAAVARARLSDGIDAGPEAARQAGFALLLAKEWGLGELASALWRAIEQRCEPVTDPTSGRFHWALGLDEDSPRGRPNAVLAAAEACGNGLWSRLAGPPPQPCPQIVDVDFPRLAVTRAEWANGCLVLRLVALEEQRTVFSSFRIIGAEPRIWCMYGLDGASTDVTSREVIVRVPLRSGELEFTPGSY